MQKLIVPVLIAAMLPFWASAQDQPKSVVATQAASAPATMPVSPFFARQMPQWQNLSFVAIPVHNTTFHKTFMIDAEGQAVSTGFAPVQAYGYNNRVVFSGGFVPDSANPYGAFDAGEAVLLGAVNYFIKNFKKKKKR